MFDLSGKSILITGSTGHIGKSLALSIAKIGAHVYVNSRSIQKCEELCTIIKENGGQATPACFDVTNAQETDKFVATLTRLDILVNNSYSGGGGTVESANEDMYLDSYKSSVVASANLTKKLLPALRSAVAENGYASVINIASMYGIVSPDQNIYDSKEGTNPPFYGAAKAALIQWTKYAACEFAKEKIRVNSISPGPFPAHDVQIKSPDFVERLIQKVPMRRIGHPDELIGPVVFLASDASSFMTGANLVVDGGWTCL